MTTTGRVRAADPTAAAKRVARRIRRAVDALTVALADGREAGVEATLALVGEDGTVLAEVDGARVDVQRIRVEAEL